MVHAGRDDEDRADNRPNDGWHKIVKKTKINRQANHDKHLRSCIAMRELEQIIYTTSDQKAGLRSQRFEQ